MNDGAEDWQDLPEGLLEQVMGGATPPPAELPIPLFDGRTVSGAYHRQVGGYPLVEVWEGEVDTSTGRARARRLGMVGLVGHDADAADLLEQFGPGVWYCAVRAAGGHVLGQSWVSTGTSRERVRVATQIAKPPPERPERVEEPPAWMQQLLEANERATERQAAMATRLQEQLEEHRRQQEEERREELREMRALLRRTQEQPPTPAPSPSTPADLTTALRARLSEAAELRTLLTEAVPEAEEEGLLEELIGQAGAVMGKGGDIKTVLDMFGKM